MSMRLKGQFGIVKVLREPDPMVSISYSSRNFGRYLVLLEGIP